MILLPDSEHLLQGLTHRYTPQQTVLWLCLAYLPADVLLCLNLKGSNALLSEVLENALTFGAIASLLFTEKEGLKWHSYTNGVLFAVMARLAMKQVTSIKLDRGNGRNNDIRDKGASETNGAAITKSVIQQDDKKQAKDERMWLIHGQEYDLSDFVDRHPGGKESILLGRGRDCTAMFESYHAFTNQHRCVVQALSWRLLLSNTLLVEFQLEIAPFSSHSCHTLCSFSLLRVVLQKYSRSQHATAIKADAFYNVIRNRVAATLREQGIDPSRHRGATPIRAAYYLLVLSGVALSGYYHLTVRY